MNIKKKELVFELKYFPAFPDGHDIQDKQCIEFTVKMLSIVLIIGDNAPQSITNK